MSLEQNFEELAAQLAELNRRLENLEAADTSRTFTGDVTTTDATATLIFQFSTATNTAYTIEATFTALRTDVAGDTASYLRVFRVKNIGGTVTISNVVVTDSEDNSSWNVTRSASGTNVNVFVVGVAAQTIKWTMVATVLQLS